MKKMPKLFAMILALALLTCVSAFAETAEIGKVAPDFEFKSMETGETVKLSDYQAEGKVVFINFWATWCPPCVMEIPDIQKLYETYGDTLEVVGVSVDTDEAAVADFIAKNGLTYTLGIDPTMSLLMTTYPSQYIPLSVFVNPQSVITYMDANILEYETMESLYREALGE